MCGLMTARLFAAQIHGKVTNGTTNAPAANAEVTLLSLAGGMEESGSTRTDGAGQFTLNVPDEGVPHLVRVAYQGANYHKAAPPGTTSVEITVYDAARKVDHLIGEGRILRLQTVGGQLEVSEMYSLRNESSPPRTQMSDQSFEITLPADAHITDGMAKGPGGMPVTSEPAATGVKGHYAFAFPIRPGATQFQVVYQMPYQGSHEFAITADMPLAELGVMLPGSMAFQSSGNDFARATDEAGMTVFVAKSISTGKQLKFKVSGEGSAPKQAQESNPPSGAAPSGSGMGGAPASTEAPGYMSLYMASTAVIIIVGGAFLALRKRKTGATAHASPGAPAPAAAGANRKSGEQVAANPSSPIMLDVLKEELFQLEADRLQGKISQQEYEKAKAGLDMLMRRQMR